MVYVSYYCIKGQIIKVYTCILLEKYIISSLYIIANIFYKKILVVSSFFTVFFPNHLSLCNKYIENFTYYATIDLS